MGISIATSNGDLTLLDPTGHWYFFQQAQYTIQHVQPTQSWANCCGIIWIYIIIYLMNINDIWLKIKNITHVMFV